MKLLLFIPLCFLSIVSRSQDLTGTWEGHSSNIASYVKMVIIRQGNTYIGYTYDEGMGFCKANFLGSFDEVRQLLTGKGMGFIERSITHSQAKFRLNYERIGNVHYLRGTVLPKTLVTSILSFGIADRVTLTRTDMNADTTVFMQKWLTKNITMADTLDADTTEIDSPQASIPAVADTAVTTRRRTDSITPNKIAVAKQQRNVDTLSTIITAEKNIFITIFDNGQVDGDTITVFHNNKILLSQHFVSAEPYRISLPLSKEQPRHEIILVANNLGSIPPNTAVLLVEAGEKKYRLTASSDLKRNVLVIFEYRE